MVQKMAFVAYSVRDVPAATTFYRDTIGLTPGDVVSEHWTEFDVGGVTFGIGNGEPLGSRRGRRSARRSKWTISPKSASASSIWASP